MSENPLATPASLDAVVNPDNAIVVPGLPPQHSPPASLETSSVGEGSLRQGQPWEVLRGKHDDPHSLQARLTYNTPPTQQNPPLL